MRVLELSAAGVEHLHEVERPTPRPQRGEVLVRMRASTLNARDLGVIHGKLPGLSWPRVPLSDGVGEIAELGDGVTRFKTGDRVCPMFYPRWSAGAATPDVLGQALGGTVDGTACEYLLLNEQALALAPAHLSDVEASSLCCAGLTAWSALAEAGVRAGDTVVVQGTGGVSLFALQFAKLLGAQVIATSSSDAKLATVSKLGADQLINYRTQPDWAQAVLDITDGRGARAVVDIGGGATLTDSVRALGFGGMVCVIGVLGGINAEVSIRQLMLKLCAIRGFTVGSRQSFEAMCAAVTQHRLKPVIEHIYPHTELGAALARMAAREHVGKLGIELF